MRKYSFTRDFIWKLSWRIRRYKEDFINILDNIYDSEPKTIAVIDWYNKKIKRLNIELSIMEQMLQKIETYIFNDKDYGHNVIFDFTSGEITRTLDETVAPTEFKAYVKSFTTAIEYNKKEKRVSFIPPEIELTDWTNE